MRQAIIEYAKSYTDEMINTVLLWPAWAYGRAFGNGGDDRLRERGARQAILSEPLEKNKADFKPWHSQLSSL